MRETTTPLDRLVEAGVPRPAAGHVWEYVESELAATLRPTAILLGGSRGHGLGNRYSDIDVVFLVDDQPDQLPAIDAVFDAMAVNLALVVTASLPALAARYTAPALAFAGITDVADDLIEQSRTVVDLTTGVVLTGDDVVAAVRAQLPRDALGALFVQSLAVIQGTIHRDAAGAATSGDWATAGESAAMALEYAADAVLAAHGDFYVQRKFLLRRLHRLDPALADDVTTARCDLLALASDRDPAATLASGLHLATGLAAHALLGWPRPHPVRGAGPVRSPYYCVARHEGGYLITGATDNGVTRAVAEAWLACDGRDATEVAGTLAARWQREPDVVRDYLTAVVRSLREAGLCT